MVYSFAYYYLGNRQEAEDVTQDVLMRFWNHWQTLDEEIVPRWLNRVTKNRSLDLLRRRWSRGRHMTDDGEDVVHQVAETGEPGPLAVVEQASVCRQVRRAILRLHEPYRSAVILREILELSYRQVADALEIPLNTAKVHVHRGRRMLRDHLREVQDV